MYTEHYTTLMEEIKDLTREKCCIHESEELILLNINYSKMYLSINGSSNQNHRKIDRLIVKPMWKISQEKVE